MFVFNNGTNVVDAVTHLSSLTLGTALPVASGGTGSTSTTFVNLTSNVTGTLPIANGGTGSTSTTFVNAATNVTGTLPVANGGTGQTTYTDGQILIGNTSTTGLAKATLTQGTGISITNGAGAITIASTATGGPTGAFVGMQVFDSPGTFTTPANTTKVYLVAASGGGGGSAGGQFNATGSRGGAGFIGAGVYPVAASTPFPVTVGGAGNGGNPNSGVGNAGGASSFGNLLTCNGGARANNPGGTGNPGTAPLATVGFAPASGIATAFPTNSPGSGITFNSSSIMFSNTVGAAGAAGNSGPDGDPGGAGGAGGAGRVIVYF